MKRTIETYKTKGNMLFVHTNGGLMYHKIVKEDSSEYQLVKKGLIEEKFVEEIYSCDILGTLMSGEDFYEHVDSGCIIDYDGIMYHIFVDGFDTNLGLYHGGFSQGEFLVDGQTFLDICKEHKVEVEWCNR